MDSIKQFQNYLRKFIDLTEDEFNEWVMPVIKVRRFGKKEMVSKFGDVENYFNYIGKGLVRKYYQKGQLEINTQISFEGHIILSQESFHSRRPSDYVIETIEPTVFVSISYDDLEKIYAASHRMEHLARLMVTYAMVIKDNWQMQLVKMTPRERFVNFVIKNPQLMQRVPQKYLASYLNIKPETFSRFKHLLRGHGREANVDLINH